MFLGYLDETTERDTATPQIRPVSYAASIIARQLLRNTAFDSLKVEEMV